MIFNLRVDPTTRHRESPSSNTLLLQGFNLYEALKIDDPQKVDWRDRLSSMRGRNLKGAIFDLAVLPKVDFYGADLEGARLNQAHFEGASLDDAYLEGASLHGAYLEGASLDFAHLEGASLDGAQLQGASLHSSDLTAARLATAFLWRADFSSAKLKSLSVEDLRWGAVAKDDELYPWTEKNYLSLKKDIEREIPFGDERRLALERIRTLDCEIKSDHFAPCDPKAALPLIAKDIGEAAVDERTYAEALAASLGETICRADSDAIYILRGLLWNGRIEATGAQAPALATRILKRGLPCFRRADQERQGQVARISETASAGALEDMKYLADRCSEKRASLRCSS